MLSSIYIIIRQVTTVREVGKQRISGPFRNINGQDLALFDVVVIIDIFKIILIGLTVLL